jgi:hypothetical protein
VTCQELFRNGNLNRRENFDRYVYLHPDGQELIYGWFKRAWNMRESEMEDSFEPFIFTWISLNGWAACVTGLDGDRDWVDALNRGVRLTLTEVSSFLSLRLNILS